MHFVIVPKVSMANDTLITVQVCHMAPASQFLRTVQIEQGSTVRQAIHASGVLQEYSELSLDAIKVGIYSKLKNLDTLLQQGDRIEIYRPLLCDPMVARRARARKKQS